MAAEEISEKSFRIRARRVHLTYKTHLDKAIVTTEMEKRGAVWVRCAHETADEDHPYIHTHVVIAKREGEMWSTTKARYFDLMDIHPNIKAIKTVDHWKRCVRYLAKEDKENADLEAGPPPIVGQIWEQPSLQEALLRCEKHTEIIPTIAAYAHKPAPQLEFPAPAQWRPWQETVIDMVSQKPDDRTILWVEDKKGGGGKSLLAKWLAINRGALVINHFGRMADIMTLVEGALASQTWDGHIFIADMGRDAQDKAIYEPLEALKNGHIQTTKYQGKVRWITAPHVVVMANFHPNESKMTQDRWRILHLG